LISLFGGNYGAVANSARARLRDQSAAMSQSPRLQENLPLRAEQGRCCPAWATENEPDPLFGRIVIRHRKAQQGVNRFSGERLGFALIVQANTLIVQANTLIVQANTLIVQANTLIVQANTLIVQANTLIGRRTHAA
jgi:hypothetical protein